jgi:hypothetical protein
MHTQDGVFIECKPVDSDHTVVKHYCNKGIARFTRGEYAWCMLSSMMVGYAASGYTVMPKLADALAKSTTFRTLSGPSVDLNPTAIRFSQDTYLTVHERSFAYQETGSKAPSITLRHLWLNRN